MRPPRHSSRAGLTGAPAHAAPFVGKGKGAVAAPIHVEAVALYRSLGFSIVGTVSEAFDHPEHGLVGLHVMHLKLR
jgi:hypothetical protein